MHRNVNVKLFRTKLNQIKCLKENCFDTPHDSTSRTHRTNNLKNKSLQNKYQFDTWEGRESNKSLKWNLI